MRQQKDELENAIKAIEEGLELGFAEQYCTDSGFNAEPFYNLLQIRIEVLIGQSGQQQAFDQAQNQMAATVEAEVQRRLAAMGVIPAPNGYDETM